MAADAVVTRWLPAARHRALDAASCAPATLAALNYVGALATVPAPLGSHQCIDTLKRRRAQTAGRASS